jgi:protein TonB
LLVVCAAVGFGQDAPKKVSHDEAMSAAVTKVQPEYPLIARQLNIRGSVELEAVVAEDGTVEKVNIVSGNPVLTRSATQALKKWQFKPCTTDGKAVKALAPVTFTFKP